MPRVSLLLSVLLLVGVANGGPVLAAKLFSGRFGRPLDGGRRLRDGRPVFGESKTVRGLVVSLCATALAGLTLGFDIFLGAAIAAGAMAGDLFSSFVKRRIGLAPHAQMLGLDQVPEALLPLLLVRDHLGLASVEVVGLTAGFVVLQLTLSQLLFRLGIRDQPY